MEKNLNKNLIEELADEDLDNVAGGRALPSSGLQPVGPRAEIDKGIGAATENFTEVNGVSMPAGLVGTTEGNTGSTENVGSVEGFKNPMNNTNTY